MAGVALHLGRVTRQQHHASSLCIHRCLGRSITSGYAANQSVGGLTEEQQEFKQVAQDFAKKELLPFSAKWDSTKHFPIDTLRAAAALGFGGIFVGEDVGMSASASFGKSYIMSHVHNVGLFLILTLSCWCFATGGSTLGRADAAVIFEALAYGDISVTAYLTIHNMVANCIDKYVLSGI